MVYLFGMKYQQRKSSAWRVSEAKGLLSQILHKARTQGPQVIGTRNQCVVVSREEWEKLNQSKTPFSSWLVDSSPAVEIKIPKRGQSASRTPPFQA